jgi:dTDP-4-amino-4,6-dideoxygalactose transaminase
MVKIPYTIPQFNDDEVNAVNDILTNPEKFISETYSNACRQILERYYRKTILMTHSCTGALEMCALLLNIKPGDEVILPSYTFVSTANAFALFGAKPIFIDMHKKTFNIHPDQIEKAISSRTKAIVVMHYAAVSCEMQKISQIAQAYQIPIIEDAAQCIGASYFKQPLGTFGQLGALSFHPTKNITAGSGGALIINDEQYLARAKVIWQKGTNREAFLEGAVDKYTWQDIGSSYALNELSAALLYGQLKRFQTINRKRLELWNRYYYELNELEEKHAFKRPFIPEGCEHNAHIFYLVAPSEEQARDLRNFLSRKGIAAPMHYVPLHLSPAGQKFSQNNRLPMCEQYYKRLIRLPLWENLDSKIDKVISTIYEAAVALSCA